MNADMGSTPYYGSAAYVADRQRLTDALLDAASGESGVAVAEVLAEVVELDGSSMVDDVVLDARYRLLTTGGLNEDFVVLDALVAVACETLGVTL